MTTLRFCLIWLAVFAGGIGTGAGALLVYSRQQHVSAEIDEIAPRHWEATIYLPRVDNQDVPIPEEKWRQVIDLFVEKFGGATLGPEEVGYWKDKKGRLRRESEQVLIVSFERDRMDDLREVLDAAGRLLDQEAMYARIEEPRILLLTIDAKSSSKEP